MSFLHFQSLSRLFLLILLALPLLVNAQVKKRPGAQAAVSAPVLPAPKHGAAKRTDETPKIDGLLDDPCWQLIDSTFSDFVQFSPTPGAPSAYRSVVKVAYDNRNIYIGAMLYDSLPKRIRKELTQRDFVGNDDYFAAYFDTFNDRQNAFSFGVTAAGVQTDNRLAGATNDLNWNAVWKSSVKQTAEGWCVEMSIPYSALRFPNRLRQQWNVNFRREVRRVNEVSYWNPINPNVEGTVLQFGKMDSVSYIKPAMRLSFTPYFVTTSRYVANPVRGQPSDTTQITGGLDMKLGLGEAYTLDMSLIPDFGQVQSDDVILNLSPFEFRFDENRPFFTENVDIFNRSNLFYSRRIGGKPIDFNRPKEIVSSEANKSIVNNPDRSSIINTLKVSGRDKKGLGFGLLNAVHGTTQAQLNRGKGLNENVLTDPRTNFNVFVVEKLMANNSYISFTNANTIREGLYRDANVTAMEFRFADKRNMFAFSGRGAISNIYQNDTAGTIQRGYAYDLGLSKVSGKLRFDLGRRLDSDTYNPNDLGFLLNNNTIRDFVNVKYVIFKPKGIVNNSTTYVNTQYTQLFSSLAFTRWDFNIGTRNQFRNFWNVDANLLIAPSQTHDYFEARLTNKKFIRPAEIEPSLSIQTDARRRIALDLSGGYNTTLDTFSRRIWFARVEPRFRVSNRFNFTSSLATRFYTNELGYADTLNRSEVFGLRNRQEIVSTLTVNYLFNRMSSVSIRARHYWAVVDYQYFGSLEGGFVKPIANPYKDSLTDRLPNRNYNAFNIDLVYRWQFAPGSEVNLIWKNYVYTDFNATNYEYGNNLNSVLKEQHNNFFSFKLLYYLDYLSIQRKKRREAVMN